jgi:serine/threonine-protein kinase
MGVVYRAVDLALGREVAIKTLPRMSPRDCQRLRSEARAVASVSHPSLALIYAEEFYRGVPMLVFEFLPGGDLARRLRSGPLPVGAAVALAGAIANALAFMHDRRILHLDVKPSNIGFTTDGGPKLLDFGVSRVLGASSLGEAVRTEDLDPEALSSIRPETPSITITAAGRVIGTPLYMSPEALRGDIPSVSFDLWSLSVTLWEALAGENPFMAPAVALVFARIGRGDVPDLREHAPHVPPELARFLSRALSPDIRLRPASAAAWKAALDAAVRSSPPSTGRRDPAPPVR